MKKRYRMFRRGRVFWAQDNETGKQETLRTRERAVAERLLHAKNEAHLQPVINMQIARAYLMVGDPQSAKRTWQDVMGEIVKLKHGETQRRWRVAAQDQAFASLRQLPLLETRAEHLLRAMEKGGVATNVYLRSIYNFALGMNWLPVAVIPVRQWPSVRYKDKRAITLQEHRAILAREPNPERRAFYELAWCLGASQSDIAFLEAENIDWKDRVISYARKKTGENAHVRFGIEELVLFLRDEETFFEKIEEELFGGLVMDGKRCAGIIVEVDTELLERGLVRGVILVDDRFRCGLLLLRGDGDGDAVFVRTADMQHVTALQPLIADEDIGGNITAGEMAEMDMAVRVR